VQSATKKLSVNAILFGILAAIIGIAGRTISPASLSAQLSQPRFMSLRLKVSWLFCCRDLRYW
jgi:hypothetical protein